MERERIEKERKEEELERKLAEEAEKKKKAMAALNANFGGQRTGNARSVDYSNDYNVWLPFVTV